MDCHSSSGGRVHFFLRSIIVVWLAQLSRPPSVRSPDKLGILGCCKRQIFPRGAGSGANAFAGRDTMDKAVDIKPFHELPKLRLYLSDWSRSSFNLPASFLHIFRGQSLICSRFYFRPDLAIRRDAGPSRRRLHFPRFGLHDIRQRGE